MGRGGSSHSVMVPLVQLSFANVPYVLLVINPTSRYSMKLLKTVIFMSKLRDLNSDPVLKTFGFLDDSSIFN